VNKGFDYLAYAVGLAKTRAKEVASTPSTLRAESCTGNEGAEATANSPAPEKLPAVTTLANDPRPLAAIREIDQSLEARKAICGLPQGDTALMRDVGSQEVASPQHFQGTTILALEAATEKVLSRARIDFEMRLQQRTSECEYPDASERIYR